MLHEISHGIASLATGGTIERIVLDPYQGGACYCGGGNAFITLSAGYLGSLLWGVVLLAATGVRRVPNQALVFLVGALVFLLTALYVRNGFGLAFGLAFGTVLMIAGRKLGAGISRVLLTALGLTSCLYAILDIKSDVLDRPELESDAAMLAELTGVPTMTWGCDLDRGRGDRECAGVPEGVQGGPSLRHDKQTSCSPPPVLYTLVATRYGSIPGRHEWRSVSSRTWCPARCRTQKKEVISCLVPVPSPTRQGQAIAASATKPKHDPTFAP